MVITILLSKGVYCTAVQWCLLYFSNSTVDNDDDDDDDNGVSCPMQICILRATDGTVETIYNTESLYPNKNMQKV